MAAGLLMAPLGDCDAKDSTKEATAPATFCGLNLPDDAERALLDLVGARKLDVQGSSHGIRDTAEALVTGRASGGNDSFVRRVHGPAGAARPTSVAFSLPDELPASAAPQFTRYRMGAMALSRPQSAVLFMNCTSQASPRLTVNLGWSKASCTTAASLRAVTGPSARRTSTSCTPSPSRSPASWAARTTRG